MDRFQQIKLEWKEILEQAGDSDGRWLIDEVERLTWQLNIWKSAMRETCEGIMARDGCGGALEIACKEREKALRDQEVTDD